MHKQGRLLLVGFQGYRKNNAIICLQVYLIELELVYVLFNWSEGLHVQLRARVDREKPVMVTATDIFPGAQYYEREVHEFFGVDFPGNEDSYKPLFLEIWDDIPPLRKDFDPQAYSDKKFPMRERGNEFVSEIGGNK